VYFELNRVILESGLKKAFVARKVGLDPNLFSKKLNGYLSITQAEKKQLAEILGKKPDELFPGQNEA
jgi:transcriptional regulator with XRE-family HTH domain